MLIYLSWEAHANFYSTLSETLIFLFKSKAKIEKDLYRKFKN